MWCSRLLPRYFSSARATSRAALAVAPFLYAVSAVAAPISNEPLSEQDKIAVQVIFTYSDFHTKSSGNGSSIRYESERSGVLEATLERYYAYAGVDSFKYAGPAQGSISIGDSMLYQTGGGTVARREEGSGPPTDFHMTVHIDSKRGVYSFGFEMGTDTRVTLEGPGMPPTIQENNSGLSYSSDDFPLPSEKDVIRGNIRFDPPLGSHTLGGNIVEEGRVMKSIDGAQQRTVHIRWQIGRPGPRPPLELILSVDDYENWLPEGPMPGATPGSHGNKATVKAKLRRKDGKPLERGAATIRFSIPQSSTEPGVCLNVPLDAKPDPKDHDLRFVDGGEASPLGPEAQEAETAVGDWHEATVHLGAFDWGAYGKVTAAAYVPNYGEVLATIEGSKDRSLRMPKRAADSHIGDAWKTQNGADGLADDDDTEKSDGNSNDGDGYTLYEEYRGIVAREEHSRRSANAKLDPKLKDLVVLMAKKGRSSTYTASGVTTTYALQPIRSHLASAMAGTRLLESAISRAHVVNMMEDEAPESRRINLNSAHAHRDAQHGILLYDLASPGDGTLAGDVGAALPLDRRDKTPKKTDMVAIDFSSIGSAYAQQQAANEQAGVPMPYTAAQEIANTVAHELAHACGVSHHGDRESGSPMTRFEQQDVAPRYVIQDVDGGEVTERPFTLNGAIAGDDSRASGDLSCIMSYPNYYAWRLRAVRGTGYIWQALQPGPMGTTLCTAPDSTPANSVFGPAAHGRGNCRAKVRIKDY